MTRLSIAAGALAVGAMAFRAAAGCSSSSDTGSVDSSADAAMVLDAAADVAVAPVDAGVGGAWVPFNDYDPTCGFFAPESVGSLPPPIRWEACAPTAIPSGISCQQMVEDWTPAPDGTTISSSLPTSVSSDGTVVMMLSRFVGPQIYRMIVDADGPVHDAILETTSGVCTLGTNDVREGKYVYRVYDSETGKQSDFGGGLIGGDVGALKPRVLAHYHDTTVDRSYVAGGTSYLEVSAGAITQHAWGDGGTIGTAWLSSDDNGLQAGEILHRGATTFWEVSSTTVAKIREYKSGTATSQEFIAFDDNVTAQGAADLGTDGKDMVWTEGSGGQVQGIYQTVSIMTSPYVEDPSALQKRRLRSTSGWGGFAVSPFVVGCGYALRSSAQQLADGGLVYGNLLVRLSDGTSWLLPTPNNGPWLWSTPLAVTCSEVFSIVNVSSGGKSHFNVARVRIDSLGPGTPAD